MKSRNPEKKRKSGNFFEAAKRQLPPERLHRAHAKALSEIFSIRLAELREKQGIKQTEVEGFTQSNVSRLESREDMKLSTLIVYLQSIGMDMEITVRSKASSGSLHSGIKLLKTG